MKTYSLYLLRDPRTNEVRYVGQTFRVSSRFRQHLTKAGVQKSRSGNWIKGLLLQGLKPLLEVVFHTPDNDYINRIEIATIKGMRKRGYDLTNISRGGKADRGWKHTEAWKEARRGPNHPLYGVPRTEEWKAAFSAKMKDYYSKNESIHKGVAKKDTTKKKMQLHQEKPETRKKHDEALWVKGNKAGFPGVRKMAAGQWMAYMKFKCDRIVLGLFDSPEYAHEVYMEAKKTYHYGFGEVKW